MRQLVSPANPLAYFRTGMKPYLLYMTLVERADRFRSGTKISIRCDYTGMKSFWNDSFPGGGGGGRERVLRGKKDRDDRRKS